MIAHSSLFADTYYVSASEGDDHNDGSYVAPFKTIQKGADSAYPGDTIYVLEGVYRERVAPPRGGSSGSPIVYMAEPGKEVYIKGSDLWSPSWSNVSGRVYSAVPPDSIFNDDVYVDHKNPFMIPVSSTPYGLEGRPEYNRGVAGADAGLVLRIGQVFVDGCLLTQKGYLSDVYNEENSWYVDTTSLTIYIHFPDYRPERHEVEISTRRRIFAPHLRQLGYIEVNGFILEHCGNQYPTNFWSEEENQQAGALGTRSGHHWTIKNNIIRFAHGPGLDFGNEGGQYQDLEVGSNGDAWNSGYHVIDSNYITNNGAGGTAAYFPRNVRFTNNVVQHNNNLHFDGYKRWETAGVKMHGPSKAIISNNLIRDNYSGWGLWLDQGSGNNTRVQGNLIIGHEIGFDLEIGNAYSDKLIFDNNVLINNDIGIGSRESGGVTTLNNIIINSVDYGLENTVDSTRVGGWESDYHHHYNNIFLNNTKHVGVVAPDYYRTADRRFEYNVYDGADSADLFEIYHGTSVTNFSDWKSAWSAYNGGDDWTYDSSSILTDSISYLFNLSTFELTIVANLDFDSLNILQHDSLNIDFFGETIPSDSTAIPGPFQDLVQGSNVFDLWGDLDYEIIDELAQPEPANTIKVCDDAYVRGGTYANDNFSTDYLQTRVYAADDSYAREVFVKFDLSDLPSNTDSVKLRLTTTNISVGTWTAYLAEDDWSEDSVTWNNKPSLYSPTQSFGSQSNSASSVLEWDVTSSALSEYSDDGILSIKVIGDVGFHGFFHSKETADSLYAQPRLVYSTYEFNEITPDADAYVRGGTYANDNFGTSDLQTKVNPGDDNYARETFLKFDLSTLPDNMDSVKLSLTTTNLSVGSWTAYLVTDDSWSEDSITWNNKPASSTSFGTETNSSSSVLEWDISSEAISEHSGDGIVSLKIVGSTGFHGFINSKESSASESLKPRLVIRLNHAARRSTEQNEAKEYDSQLASIYPNPSFDGLFNLTLKDERFTNWEMFDYSGRSIANGYIKVSDTSIIIKGYRGLGYIRVYGPDIKPVIFKVIIK